MPSLKKKLKKAAGFTLDNLFNGEKVANNIGGLGLLVGYDNPDLGTDISKGLGGVPYAGGALQVGFSTALAPATWLTAGVGPSASSALKGAGPLGRVASSFVSPVLSKGNLLTRVGAEVGVGMAGKAGSDVATELAPEPLKPYAPIVGALAGGGAAVRTLGSMQARQAALNAPTPGIGGAAVDKLTELIKKGKRAERVQAGLYRAERGVRSEAYRKAFEAGGYNPASYRRAQRTLKGALPQAQFTFANNENVDPADVNSLIERIWKYYPENRTLTANSTMRAFQDLVFNKQLPTKSELREFERIFGTKFVNAILQHRGPGAILHENIMDIINLPRALMSSLDLSAPFNQGAMAVTRKEWWTSWKPMLKAFASEEGAQNVAESIRKGRYYDRGLRAGLHEASLGRIGAGEEAFASRFAHLIPGVRRSERAYVTFLNKLRWDLWDTNIAKYERAGFTLSKAEEKKLANVYNVLTGRGNMPGREVADTLNAFLFSPRRLTSVVERAAYAPVALAGSALEGVAGRQVLPGSMIARREAARDLVGFISAGVGVLTLMNLSGIADVELDPRSPDFGKGRIGKMRYDPWGGFQQVARYTTQVATGQRKDSLGRIGPADRTDTFWRFWQSKLAPVQGFVADATSGRTMTGDTVDLQNSDDLKEQAINRLTPLFLQNLDEAAKQEGALGFLKAIPGGTGIGVQTYETISDVRARVLEEAAVADPDMAGKTWDDLTPGQQQDLEEAYRGAFDKVRVQSDFEDERMNIEEQTRTEQRNLNAKLNDPVAPITPEQFRREMETLQDNRRTRLEQARKDYGIKYRDDDTAVNRWYDLREEAKQKYGIVDPMMLDDLQEEFYNTLTAAEQKKVDDLREYRPDPSVKWFFDAKDTISEGGYWDAQKQALSKFKSKMPPGVETMYDLMSSIQAATLRGDTRQAARLTDLLNAVNTLTRDLRTRLRRKNKALDDALVLVYDVEPMHRR